MKRRMHTGLALTGLLLGTAQADTLVTHEAIADALAAPDVAAWVERAPQASLEDNPARLAELARDLEQARMSELARAALLAEFVPLLRSAPATPDIQAVLREFAQYRNDFVLRHDEGYNLTLPAFPVAAMAEAALRFQDGRRAAEAALAGPATTANPPADNPDPAWRAGVVAALTAADVDTLRPACATFVAGDWLGVCARRLKSPEFYRKLLSVDIRAAVPALAELRATLNPDTATALLKEAASKPALRSAAYYQLARLPDGPEFLLAEFGKPEAGEAAAAALADNRSPAVLDGLTRRLDDGSDLAQRQAVLALKLRGDTEARAVLKNVSRDPAKPARLRKEVRQWLGD